MKIKVLKFTASNSSSFAFDSDKKESWYIKGQAELKSPQDIEKEVNKFCEHRNIIDISVTVVPVRFHNHARGNTIELWYTIKYNETKKALNE